jgi:hypothetical protein
MVDDAAKTHAFSRKKNRDGPLEGLEASFSLLSSAPENAVVMPLCPTTEKRKRKRSKGAEKSEAFVSLQSRQWSRSFFLFLDLDLEQQLALSLSPLFRHSPPTNQPLSPLLTGSSATASASI